MFLIAQTINENKDVFGVVSKIDNREYIVRKLPDAQQSADKLAIFNKNMIRLLDHIKDDDKKGVKYLVKRYNPDQLSETAPGAKYTSYSVNKGESIAMCLREPNNSYIDMNTVNFVIIHELSHVMTKSIGHKSEFWSNFKFMLECAKEAYIHNPVDYKKEPQEYCGMKIHDNPYYDA